MAFVAKVHQDGRATGRHHVELGGTLRDEERRPFDICVIDLSVDGFRATGAVELVAGASIGIGLPGLGVRRAMVVRAQAGEYGCRFGDPLTPAELSATIVAEANAPVPFPESAYAEPSFDTAVPVVKRLPVLQRLALISVAAGGCWAVLFGTRLLLG